MAINGVFIVVLPLVKVWWPRQKVGLKMSCSRFVVKSKMILRELCNPSSLSPSDILGLSEIFEVFMVGMDFKRFVCAYQIMSPFFEG